MNHSLEGELRAVPNLSIIVAALVEFALTRIPGTVLERRPSVWVGSHNFFALRVLSHKLCVRFSVYGQVREFDIRPELPLTGGRGGSYSEFRLSSPAQLLAGCVYLAKSAQLFGRGRSRFRAA